jgi:hypothetical protein
MNILEHLTLKINSITMEFMLYLVKGSITMGSTWYL